MPKKLLTNKEIEHLISGFLDGKWNAEKLPYWLYDKLSDNLLEAGEKGWGSAFGEGVNPSLELKLKENVFYFAGSKTASEMSAMQDLFNASKNKADFIKRAVKLDKKYNVDWLETEYNTTSRMSLAGREWEDIQKTKEIFPNLRYIFSVCISSQM